MRSVPSQCSALGARRRWAGCSSSTSSGCVASTGASNAHATRPRISRRPISADRSRARRASTNQTALIREIVHCRAMLDFTGHVVLVTGGAAGIGFGIADAFHAAGARVALGDLRADALDRARGKLGNDVFTHAMDVRDEGSVDAFVDAAERALGPATIAVANAGIYPNAPVLEMTVEEWDRVMETNVRGVFLTCRA